MTIALGLLLLFSLIFLANMIEVRKDRALGRGFSWILLIVNLPIFILGLALLLVPPELLQNSNLDLSTLATRPAGLVLLLSAVWGLLVLLPQVRGRLARVMPLDPRSAVHTLALILAGYLIGNSAVNLTQGGLQGLAESSSAASIVEVVASELLYACLGLAGVGIFIRRSRWKVVDRLGLELPTMPQLRRSLRWVGLLLLLQFIAGGLLQLLDPQQAEVLDDLNTLLLGDMDTVWEWFLLASSAAVGEEILFRGAIQPVFGLWVTAFLFAFVHVQYGFTLVTVLVFVIGLVLGLIRRRYNTGVAIFVHFGYNFILGLFTLLAPYVESMAT